MHVIHIKLYVELLLAADQRLQLALQGQLGQVLRVALLVTNTNDEFMLGGTTCLKLLLSNMASAVSYGVTRLIRLIELATLFTTCPPGPAWSGPTRIALCQID